MSARKKKGPSSAKAKAIIALRDELIKSGMSAEVVGPECKGMYRCDKLADDKCLDGILAKLKKLQDSQGKSGKSTKAKEGGRAKARARSRSRSRSRSKSKPRRK